MKNCKETASRKHNFSVFSQNKAQGNVLDLKSAIDKKASKQATQNILRKAATLDW